jgi:hypothetical protein
MGKAGFETLQFGKTKTSTRVGEFGSELGTARGLSAAAGKKPFYLVKYHASGMPLHHGFDRGKWAGGEPALERVNFYPGTKPRGENRGTLYGGMMNRLRAALEALKKKGAHAGGEGFRMDAGGGGRAAGGRAPLAVGSVLGESSSTILAPSVSVVSKVASLRL